MDAKLWTVGTTLFALLYLTLAVTLVWSVVVIALVMAAWVLSLETEGPEGLRYVELELRPALAMVAFFCLTLVILGPHFPPIISRSLYPVQYSSATAVMHATPVYFFFPLVPLMAGFVMSVHQRLHPLGGIVYQTPPATSTKVHVHLHNTRAAVRDEEDEEDEEEEEASAPRHRKHHRLRELEHRLRRPRKVHAVAEEDEGDEDEPPRTSARRHRKPLHASDSGEL
jgi:hypothetical protein